MNDTILVSTQSPVQERANYVKTTLAKLSSSIEDDYYDMCDLLCETQEGGYHHLFGFERFSDWIETASGLDISARECYYLINISKKAKELGLTREQLKVIKVSKLKVIFSLELAEHAEAIKDLIREAPGLSLDEVKDRVRALKGQGEVVYMTLKLERSIKDTVDKALEMARRSYGSQMQNGEATDISTSHCVELICVEFLNDPNNNPENQDLAEEQE